MACVQEDGTLEPVTFYADGPRIEPTLKQVARLIAVIPRVKLEHGIKGGETPLEMAKGKMRRHLR